MATITVDLHEQKNFKPEAPITLGDRMAAAWINSTGDLRTFLSDSTVSAVSVAPWLVIWVPLLLLGGLLLRLILRRAAAAEVRLRSRDSATN